MKNLLKVTSKIHLNICQQFKSYAYTVPLNHQYRRLYMDFQSLQVTRDRMKYWFSEAKSWKSYYGGREISQVHAHPTSNAAYLLADGERDCPAGCASFTPLLMTTMPEGELQPPLPGREQQKQAWRRMSRSQGWPQRRQRPHQPGHSAAAPAQQSQTQHSPSG